MKQAPKTSDYFLSVHKVTHQKFHNETQIKGYYLSHTTPDKKGRFAIKMKPLASLEEAKATHSIIKTYMHKHLCPKYKYSNPKNPDLVGKSYNFGAYTGFDIKPGYPYSPLFRKDQKDIILTGRCMMITKRR